MSFITTYVFLLFWRCQKKGLMGYPPSQPLKFTGETRKCREGTTPRACLGKQVVFQKTLSMDFAGGTEVKNLPAKAGDMGSSPGPGRSHMPRSN